MPVPVSVEAPRHYEGFARTVFESALGGAIGGWVCFPWESLKKRLQRGELAPSDFRNWANGRLIHVLHPRELYRGSGGFGAAVMTATASSMTFNALLKEKLPGYNPHSLIWQGSAAVASGMLGAVVGSTPVENMLLVQQQHRIGPSAAVKWMMQQGVFRPWVGVRELMLREAGFAGVMLFAAPIRPKNFLWSA